MHPADAAPYACTPRAQVAKLLVIPFVCFVEVVFLRRSITLGVVAPMAVVVMGVAVV